MGDEGTKLSAVEAGHLLRRTGFGALKKDVDRILASGETRGEAADRLLDFRPKNFRPGGRDFETSHNRWLRYLVRTRSPLQAKLVLFWHDHFATGFSKVQDVALMADQILLLHRECAGNVKQLMKDMNRNPAMMEFLDTVRNRRAVPNENYARELQELFTLGVVDLAGNPNYTQEDIVQIARAFTGWRYDDRRKPYLDTDRHDYAADFPKRGPKVIYKTVGGFGPGGHSFTVNGEGEPEIDAVIDIIFDHTDTDGKNTVARRTARRLLEFFAHPSPSDGVVDDVVGTSHFDTDFEIKPLLRAIFTHDAFYETATPAPFGAGTKKSVKWPVDYVVSTLRLVGMRPKGRYLSIEGGDYQSVLNHLSNMGQVLLDPPSVFGWDWETAWISSSTLLARYGFARDVTGARDGGITSFRPERLIDLGLSDPGDIVDAVSEVLGLAVRDDNGVVTSTQLTANERNALIAYLGGPLDLQDYDTRNTKLHGLFALLLQSPAYQLH